jgi:hypothetical protein
MCALRGFDRMARGHPSMVPAAKPGYEDLPMSDKIPMKSKLLVACAHAPRALLMAVPLIAVLLVSGGLLVLVHEGSHAAAAQIARQQAPRSVAPARAEPSETAFVNV